ncbi:MAG: Asp-tRNA(Asn)/Glu-tRNA(Gln) amidotransferase subunit GatB, partial [Candidatus Paceibacteria bacterium]
LPTINKKAVEAVLKLGLALNSQIPEISKFDRKNYFYPDLPKGFQISQYQHPLVKGGEMILKSGRKIRIRRIHLEEDTAKIIHAKDGALIDYNRAGIPLMELVTEPDIISSEEAGEFSEELHLLARTLNISEADMEKGEMRIEANVSVSENGKEGTKVEIKNINSFKAVREAIDYEISRQTEVLKSGGKITHETRGWDEDCRETIVQRLKEEAHDYRYFPEPDLLPLDLTKIKEFSIERLRAEIPEIPNQKRARFAKEYGLKKEQIEIMTRDKRIADFFEKTISELLEWVKEEKDKQNLINLGANYLLSDVLGIAKAKEIPFDELLLTPENFAELLKMMVKNEITSRTAKDVLLEMIEKGGDA